MSPNTSFKNPITEAAIDDRGQTLLFSSEEKAREEDPEGLDFYLYRARLGETDLIQLELLGSGRFPQISANGRWVVFLDSNEAVQLVRTDGSLRKTLTPFDSMEVDLTSTRITGDGRRIAVLGEDSQGRFLAALDREGELLGRVELPEIPRFSDWSLDGSGNACFASREPIMDNPDGSREIFAARLLPYDYFLPDVPVRGEEFTAPI